MTEADLVTKNAGSEITSGPSRTSVQHQGKNCCLIRPNLGHYPLVKLFGNTYSLD